MKLRTVIYSLLLATLCMGCGGSLSMRQLEQLEARMNDAPDSVLTVLTATDMPRWGEARALYALLTVQAQDKSYVDVTNDSLISVATDYYQRKGQPLRRLQAFYYHGLVYQRSNSHHKALLYYTRALDFVPHVDAPYPVGLLYAHIGSLYSSVHDHPQALGYIEEAYRCYELAGKERLMNFAKQDIGRCHFNMHNFSLADSLYNEVLTWSEANNDSYIMYRTLNSLLRLYDATGNTEALDTLLDNYPLEAVARNATAYGIIALHNVKKNDKAAAENAMARAWKLARTAQDTTMLWQRSYQVYKVLGYADKALDYYESLYAYQDSVVRITLRQPLIASLHDYYHSELDLAKARNLNYLYFIGFSILAVLAAFVILRAQYREAFRKKEAQIKRYMDTAEQLRITLYDKEEELGRASATLHQRIASLFKEQYNLLDELCTTYYENPKDEQRSKHIFEKVKSVIDTFSSDEGYAKLETIVNESRHNVITLLRSELPKFKETDYRLLCYFCAGLSVQTISLFTKEEPEKLWVYKGRLIARIAKSDAPNKEIILAQIPQRTRKA